MTIDELQEYAKTHFPDKKFVDQLIKFVAERDPEASQMQEVEKPVETEVPADMQIEKTYKIYVVLEKLVFLHEVLENMPLIVNIDKNLSLEMGKVFAHRQAVDVKSKVAALGETKSLTASQINRHDPHLQKLMELIYVNIKKRF